MANGLVMRQSVEQADISSLRDAYGKMQDISPTDNRSWAFWAGLHGFPQNACWHEERFDRDGLPYNFFLPWHRAFLIYFEHAVRDQNEAAILPWWDWTSPTSHEVGVPTAFAEPEVDGQRNPLFNGPKPDMPDDPGRLTRRFPGPPERLPGPDLIEDILETTTDFVDFSEQIQDVHNRIHGWTGGVNPDDPNQGGDMGVVASAAYDPVFWSHHCMIDRLWYLWQLRHGIFNIPPVYLGRSLGPFGLNVEEVLDIGKLGYSYASSSSVVTV